MWERGIRAGTESLKTDGALTLIVEKGVDDGAGILAG